MDKIVKNGEGWRLGWDGTALEFKALVGGENWAIELTEAEFNDLRRLLQQLAATMAQMSSELMDEERITCEAESDRLWIEAEGYPHAYRVHFILNCGRRCEGEWPPAVVPELVRAMETIAELGNWGIGS